MPYQRIDKAQSSKLNNDFWFEIKAMLKSYSSKVMEIGMKSERWKGGEEQTYGIPLGWTNLEYAFPCD